MLGGWASAIGGKLLGGGKGLQNKAVIYSLNKSEDTEPFVIQADINPSSIRHSISINSKHIKGIKENGSKKSEAGASEQTEVGFTPNESLSMELVFDIANKYEGAGGSSEPSLPSMSSIMDMAMGAMPGFKKTGEDASIKRFDIKDLQVSGFSKLEQWAKNGTFVAFQWGSIVMPGTIHDYNCNYTYFSKQGFPLRAEVSLTIRGCDIPDSSKKNIEKPAGASDEKNESVEN